MEKSTTAFWMDKIIEDIIRKERKRIQEDMRTYCNQTKEEFVTYPAIVRIINLATPKP